MEKLSAISPRRDLYTTISYSSETCHLAFLCYLQVDSNDHVPVFVGLPYFRNIPENTHVGMSLFEVNATDVDTQNDYGVVRFSFDNQTELLYGSTFDLDAVTGVVTLSSPLDRESIPAYVLTVVATDNQYGSGRPLDRSELSTTSSIRFTVTDINDETPQFSFPAAGSYPDVTLAEHTQFSTFVAEVVATDGDIGSNAVLNFSLSGDNGKLSIETFTRGADVYVGRILTIPPLDFETQRDYTLNVTVFDEGMPSLSSTTTIIVHITDSNDNAPQFNQSQYSASVFENTGNHTSVIRVFAQDSDSGAAGAVRYSIAGDDGKFSINTISGVIFTTADPLDRELKSFYTLLVTAFDLSNQSFASTARVLVTVLDRNDETPIFTSSTYNREVVETIEPGTSIFTLSATDADIDENGNFTFSLDPATADGWFVVDPDTGIVTVSHQTPNVPFPLPLCINDTRETKKYDITVFVTDTGVPQRQSNATLVVTVRDVNDYTPEFERPSYISRLDRNAPMGTVVVPSLVATDRDRCGGNLTYRLVSGPADLFTVNGVTGRTVLARDIPTNNTYFLTMGAEDSLSPIRKQRLGTVRLTVLVGRLLPVSLAVGGPQTFKVPELGRSSELEYVHDVWTYDGGSTTLAASTSFSLAGFTATSSVASTAQAANFVGAKLSERDIWPENPIVRVGAYIRGDGHRPNNLLSSSVTIIVTPQYGGLSPVSQACSPSALSGLCFSAITLPATWFSSSSSSEPLERNATVAYRLTSSSAPIMLDTLIIHRNPNTCSVNLGIQAVFPSSYYIPGQSEAKVDFFGHARYPVSTFTVTVSLGSNVQYRREVSPAYTVTTTTQGSTVVFSGLIDDQTRAAVPVTGQELLFSMYVRVRSGAAQPASGYLPVTYSVNFLTNVNKELVQNPAVMYASRNENGRCNDTQGRIYVLQNDLLYLLSYTDNSVILNSAVWDGNRVSSWITVVGTYRSGQQVTESTGLSCSSTSPNSLRTTDCTTAFVNGTELSGAPAAAINIAKNSVSTSVLFRVWFPDQITIYMVDTTLNSILGLRSAATGCRSPVHQESAVRVECSLAYDGGASRRQIIITRNVRNNIRSSATSTVALSWNGDALTARGLSAGQAQLQIVAGGRTVSSLNVTVTDTTVNVTDLHFELVTGLNTSQLTAGVVGTPHYQTSSLTVQREMGYENAMATVVASAIFSDGHQMQISTVDGLNLSSLNTSVLTISGTRATVLQSGRGLLLAGSWVVPCNGVLLKSTSALYEFNLDNPERIELTISRTLLTTSGDASTLLGTYYDSASVSVRYVYRSGALIVDVTNDTRLRLNFTGNAVQWSQTSPGTLRGGSQVGVVNVTAYLMHRPALVSSPVAVTVISSSSVVVSVRVWSNGVASQATTTRLRRYADVSPDTYQQGQITATLVLSNDDRRDVSSHPRTLYTVPALFGSVNGRDLTVNGTAGSFVLSANFSGVTGSLGMDFVASDLARLVQIVSLTSSVGNTLAGVVSSTTATLDVEGEFSDGTRYPGIVRAGVVNLPGLLRFSSNNTRVIAVGNADGVLRLHANSPNVISITAQSASGAVQSSVDLFANLQSAFADMDIGRTTGSPLQPIRVGSTFTVAVRLNVLGRTVGAVKLELKYDQVALSVGDVAPGSGWPGGIFEKTTNDPPGEVAFGGSISSPHTGTSNLELATITFTANTAGLHSFNASIIQLTEQGASGNDIGAAGPRLAVAGQVMVWVYGSSPAGRRRRSMDEFVEYDTVRTRERRATVNYVLGDTNDDGSFDLRDVQFLQTYLLERTLVNQNIVSTFPTSEFRSLTPGQLSAMDPDLSGDINPEDSVYLVRVNFKLQRFVTNIEILPSQGVGSNCSLAINVSVWDLYQQTADTSDTAVLIGLTHTNRNFQSQFNSTRLFTGTLLSQSFTRQVAQYGGFWQASDFGNGIFGVRTVPSEIAQNDIGLTIVLVTFDSLGTTDASRQVVIGGTINPPFAYQALDVTIPISSPHSRNVRVLSTNGYNPVQYFNNTIPSSICFNFHPPVFRFSDGQAVDDTAPHHYVAREREDFPVGDVVATVTATDGDVPLPSGDVEFTIISQVLAGTFGLNKTSDTSADLILITPLDWEASVPRDEYKAVITATDQGKPCLTTKGIVCILLLGQSASFFCCCEIC